MDVTIQTVILHCHDIDFIKGQEFIKFLDLNKGELRNHKLNSNYLWY